MKVQVQHCCVHKIFFECQNKNTKDNFCTQHMLGLYFSCNSMNNVLSYNWLIDARMRGSDKDLPVLHAFANGLLIDIQTSNLNPSKVQDNILDNPKTKVRKIVFSST